MIKLKNLRNLFLIHLGIGVILALLTYAGLTFFPGIAVPFVPSLIVSLTFVNLILLFFFGGDADPLNPQAAIRKVIVFFGLKLLAYLVIVIVFFLIFRTLKYQLAVVFLSYYMLFSIFNVWWLTKKRKDNNKSKD